MVYLMIKVWASLLRSSLDLAILSSTCIYKTCALLDKSPRRNNKLFLTILRTMKDPGVRCAARDLDFFHQLPVSAAWCNKNKKCPKQHILAWETCPTLRAFVVRKLRRILCTVELWVGYFGASPRAMTHRHHKPENSIQKSFFFSFIWYMMFICCR